MSAIIAGIGELATSNSQPLSCIGLGSCVAVILYDPINKIGGIAHVMLPDSSLDKGTQPSLNQTKYADVAIPKLLEQMKQLNAHIPAVIAKISGGGNMFPDILIQSTPIGERNVEAIKSQLQKFGIKIVAQDVLGTIGRSTTLDINSGKVTIHTKNGDKEI